MPLQVNSPAEPRRTPASITSIAEKMTPPDTVGLTMALQTTLDAGELLAIFSRWVAPTVPHDGLAYRHDGEGVALQLGTSARNSTHYTLDLDGTALGELRVSRSRPFAEQDLARLEYFLCTLLYPMRNALTYRKAQRAALEDPLTGAGNRAALEQSLNREIELARRSEHPLTLVAIDLDHFKRVNDLHGHSTGDAVLKSVAARIRQSARTSDLLYRYGGEEFVLLLSHTDLEGGRCVAERILRNVGTQPIALPGLELHLTVSIGVAQLRAQEEKEALFERADAALYRAKAHGRNCVELQSQ